MEKVLVAGATGKTGRKVVQLLKTSQYFRPVAMVRKESQKAQFEKEQIDTVLGDLKEDVAHTVQDIDKVVFAAGSGGKEVVAVDQEGAKKLIDASKKEGIKKFVMLSSMGAGAPQKATELQEYLEAKHKADEHLRESELRYAIVRPGPLTNEKSTGKIKLGQRLGQDGSISREDVAQTLVRALHDDTANDKTFEILEGDTLIGKAMDKISS
ncbi:SDR family oxidoreductase [Flavobacteriaceae bacterium TP-CH-4]|uniref:SDR family oxidoreductase n=1 Tax=Pelagihabitans pacificus TaxID=2696054 RepID=A0A967AV46_9FLAO|nr:SDR family oxidoreductase [Pelagihabitans pacificus]NHF59945.1 SDR family oxidoreductase [Pelagihabitans pacificus]